MAKPIRKPSKYSLVDQPMTSHACTSADPLVSELLNQDYSVSVERGRLVVNQRDGTPMAKKWINRHHQKLVDDLLKKTGHDALVYIGYSADKYGENLAGGVTLQFKYAITGAEAYAIFNADLTRSRTTKHGKAGDPLPKGHFHVAKSSLFLKFWKKSGAAMARSRTDFHRRMGNLKLLLFTGSLHRSKKNKLINGTIFPLGITHEQVMDAYSHSDKSVISRGQLSDNSVIRASDKETLQPAKTLGLPADFTTGDICYGNTLIRKKVTRDNVYPIDALEKAISDIPVYAHEDPETREWIVDMVKAKWNEAGLAKHSRHS